MATTYEVRTICETEAASVGEPGYQEGWHYCRKDQTTLDNTWVCPDHGGATNRDFVIEKIEITE